MKARKNWAKVKVICLSDGPKSVSDLETFYCRSDIDDSDEDRKASWQNHGPLMI